MAPQAAGPGRKRRSTSKADVQVETMERHVLDLQLDERCRALARVLALVEGRGLTVGEVRFSPATASRRHAEATVEVLGAAKALETVLARIEALPSVRRALVDRHALLQHP